MSTSPITLAAVVNRLIDAEADLVQVAYEISAELHFDPTPEYASSLADIESTLAAYDLNLRFLFLAAEFSTLTSQEFC